MCAAGGTRAEVTGFGATMSFLDREGEATGGGTGASAAGLSPPGLENKASKLEMPGMFFKC